MSNVINLADRKTQKAAERKAASQDYNDHLERVRTSLEKINILLAAVKEQQKGKNK